MKEKRKKKEKLTESLHLTVEMTGSSNYKSHKSFAQTNSLPKPQSGST